jgi:hypothetical protein
MPERMLRLDFGSTPMIRALFCVTATERGGATNWAPATCGSGRMTQPTSCTTTAPVRRAGWPAWPRARIWCIGRKKARCYEPANQTWFLFTNHVGLQGSEYTDAIWSYWTKDLNRWNSAHKAVVLDWQNCSWSKTIIGLPSVLKSGNRLAVFYDGSANPLDTGHMKRHIGLAWLDLPLIPPSVSAEASAKP